MTATGTEVQPPMDAPLVAEVGPPDHAGTLDSGAQAAGVPSWRWSRSGSGSSEEARCERRG